jgi:hypothetical protein
MTSHTTEGGAIQSEALKAAANALNDPSTLPDLDDDTVGRIVLWLLDRADEVSSPTGNLITPGGNPACDDCGQWYGPGVEHVCPTGEATS